MRTTKEIHQILRKLQIKNRRVRKGAEIPVAIAEAHVLVELHAGEELSVNELAGALLIPQSQVSRVLQKLRSRRLIQQRGDTTDSRRSLSSLSRAGFTVIKRIDDVMGELYQECVDRISKQEEAELSLFLEHVAHGLGSKQIRRRKDENRLRAAHRQMARVLGLLGGNVYDSDLTRSQWAILEALYWAPEPISATIIEGYLGIKPAVISEILNRFELEGYIERTRSKENHRMNLLRLTGSGRRYFGRLESRSVLRLHTALGGVSSASRKRSLELLKRFAGEWGANSIFLGKTLKTSLIADPHLIREARGFVFREIVRLGWEYSAPDPLFPRGQEIWGLFDTSSEQRSLRAVCIANEGGDSWGVTLCAWSSTVNANQVRAFIQHAHYISNRRGVSLPLTIKFEPLREMYPEMSR